MSLVEEDDSEHDVEDQSLEQALEEVMLAGLEGLELGPLDPGSGVGEADIELAADAIEADIELAADILEHADHESDTDEPAEPPAEPPGPPPPPPPAGPASGGIRGGPLRQFTVVGRYLRIKPQDNTVLSLIHISEPTRR
eukprot:2356540-Lingulodinium_polyedra.AAC.1